MTTNTQPIAPPHLIEAAQTVRENAFAYNIGEYNRGNRTLNAVVRALRQAYRQAEEMLAGFRL